MTDDTAPLLLYDGVCGICNRAIQTIIRHDRHGTLRFAALDSDFARGVIERHPDLRDLDSMVFVDNPGRSDEQVSVRSAAGLRVVSYLGGPFRILLAASVIPANLRDRLYDRFAAVRYRFGGRHGICPVPTPEVRARFLDS
ncbi:thiol-disulfide oxidoreductase DCC family protein [[Mycobacterium] vasticus]|uniref:DCC1-like thiol-disulfide oxidoreductase family protein n=1 Tax=[Mycobacterium] vasticus TaxID=2875777 RepID=A0ABU5Z3G6_9MYCO|nr:DCC1-like thiol-disulfide oxidoreductase family protein [Mycolicibacter sp. MYC017]MEB3071948.1 DCC1-like thiol-disulfide oxidoreductase family protein [Mycolicibacter sp. MYC017]